MADGTSSSGDQPFSNKTILPPIGGKSVESSHAPSSDPVCRPKVKHRPAKLKSPLDQLGSSMHFHRPIGTPPPTSLRKPVHGETIGQASGAVEHFGFFPKINVENCPEGHDPTEGDDVTTPNGAVNPRPDNRKAPPNTENNNGSESREGGLTPPTRLVTRDQDGVVFELTGGQVGSKQSPLTPTKKPIRLEPILK